MKNPHFIARIGGIKQLSCKGAQHLLERLQALNAANLLAEKTKAQLCDNLHNYNKTLSDGNAQKVIQNLRRTIFNNRDFQAHYEACEVHLPSALAEAVRKRKETLKSIQKEQLKLKSISQELFVEEIKCVCELVSQQYHETLRSLPLSSVVFAEQLLRKTAHLVNNAGALDKKDKAVISTAYRYLSRIAMKTSPFGHFNAVVNGIVSEQNKSFEFEHDKGDNTKIELNNAIFRLIKFLLQSVQETDGFLVRANPTVKHASDTLLYFIDTPLSEKVNRLKAKPIFQDILTFTQQSRTLTETHQFVSSQVDNDPQSVSEYLHHLVTVGLLTQKFPASELNSNWPQVLISVYQNTQAANLRKIGESLKQLVKNMHEFSVAAIGKRIELLHASHSVLIELANDFMARSTSEKLREKFTGKGELLLGNLFLIRKESIFYENVVSTSRLNVSRHLINDMEASMNKLHAAIYLQDSRVSEKLDILQFWNTRLANETSVGLLEFYEMFHKDARQDQETTDPRSKYIPNNSEYRRRIDDFARIFAELIDPMDVDEHSVLNLSSQLFDGFQSSPVHYPSYATHVQLVQHQEKSYFIVNKIHDGNGKLFSRFLNYFDDSFIQSVRSNLLNLSDDSLLIEVSDGSSFNANMRPKLLDHELVFPNGAYVSEESTHLQITDFDIRIFDDGDIGLFHRTTGKRAYVVDTSFQDSNSRSSLYRFLSNFSFAKNGDYSVILTVINIRKVTAITEHVKKYPRIVIDDLLIIQRAFWLVDKACLPVSLKDDDYFLALNLWRMSLNIPDEIFFTLKSSRLEQMANQEDVNIDYKPQYLNFSSPISVMSFQKQIKSSNQILRIEEMYPTKECMITDQFNNHYVSEFVIQVG